MRKKCKSCQVGMYSHGASEDVPLYEDLEHDGLGSIFSPTVYNFCPACGHPVNKDKFFKLDKKRKRWNWK